MTTSLPAARPAGAGRGVPFGAIFAGIGIAACVAVGLFHLDRLPVNFCTFKQLTGLPCPSCGTTRTLGRLFALDLPGAVSMNPLAAVAALALLAWGLADLALAAGGRRLRFAPSPRLARGLRILAVAAMLVNWGYLVLAGR